MMPDGLPPLREVIRKFDLTAQKGLSQNFILDFNLTRRIARAGGPLDGVTVIEVGPGPGGLTRALLIEGAARVIAIERDERCLPALKEIADQQEGRLEILHTDALTVDYAGLAKGKAPLRIIANLPYAVATPLLVSWIMQPDWPPWYDSLILMFQREVAERITAVPGSKVYGRLSVLCQWRALPQILFHVRPEAFTPPPKVASSLVRLAPRTEPLLSAQGERLEAITAAAFGQRRKMLRSSLKPVFGDVEAVLSRLGIPVTARAEELKVEDFCRLATLGAETGKA